MLIIAKIQGFLFGDPERIRTSDPRIRNPLLYPAELPNHMSNAFTIIAWKAIVCQWIFKKKHRKLSKKIDKKSRKEKHILET